VQVGLVSRAIAAATSLAGALDLKVNDAIVIQNSNTLALRLLPCDVFARTALVGQEVAAFEVRLARGLAAANGPVASLDPRVEPRVYEVDGFAITFWTYYEATPDPAEPAEYAVALQRLHAAMRNVQIEAPHFMERAAEAERVVTNRSETPALDDRDRDLLLSTLHSASEAIQRRAANDQLLHGEPHPGNLLSTPAGIVFVDFETCCVGPIEFRCCPRTSRGEQALPGSRSSSTPGVSTSRSRASRCLALGRSRSIPQWASTRQRHPWLAPRRSALAGPRYPLNRVA